MGFKNIEKKSFWYDFAKKCFVEPWHNLVYYRKVHVNHEERIPENGHLIFTPNHQNALMDAIGPLCNIKRQLVFLARSDIFKKKKIAGTLYFLKILPVFRIRDGYSSVKKNSETFDKTIDVIKGGNGLVILPEGDYVRKNQLRPLKKGFARIAFQTEEANDFKLDLKIIPLGLHYSDYDEIRGDLIINVGYPIPLSDYTDLYKETPAVAINKITSKLSESLRLLMLDIKEGNYQIIKDLLTIRGSLSKDISVEQKLVSDLENYILKNPEEFSTIIAKVEIYHNKLKKLGLKSMVFNCKLHKSFRLITESVGILLGLPLFLLSTLNNLIPYLITEYFVRKVKDEHFKHSFRFVISLVSFVIFYLIQVLFVGFFTSSFLIALVYAACLPFSLIFSIEYAKQFKLTWLGWRLFLAKLSRPAETKDLLSLHNSLVAFLKNLG